MNKIGINSGLSIILAISFLFFASRELSGNTRPLGEPAILQPGAVLPNVTGTIGETLSIPINATNLTNLEGVDIIIQFDAGVVQVLNATLTGGMLAGQNYNLIFNTAQAGKIIITIYAQGNLISGSGNLVFISFKCLNNGSSPLTFSKFDVNETNYLANCTNGSITIGNIQNQSISLNQGWTGISSYLIPQNTDIGEVFSSISGNLIIVKNLAGDFYQPSRNNSLVNWDYQEGYFVKSNSPTTLVILGNQPTNKQIVLNAGWNLLPVLSSENVSIATLFASQVDQVKMIKEAIGLKLFWPGNQISTLQILETGKSYLVFMNQEATIGF
jgi:hypothetical protein